MPWLETWYIVKRSSQLSSLNGSSSSKSEQFNLKDIEFLEDSKEEKAVLFQMG